MSSVETATSVVPTQWLTILVVFAIPIIIMYLFKRKENPSLKGLNLPPCPPQLPFIGNLHQLTNQPHVAFTKFSKTYGPIMRFQLGKQTAIVCSSPEICREAMKDKDLDCCSRPLSVGPGMLSYNFLDVAFSPYSDYWREMRKMFIFELLSMKRVHMFWYAREQEIDRMISEVTQAYPNTVNLTTKIFAAIDGFAGTVAMGKNYSQMEFKDDFVKVMRSFLNMLGSFTAEDYFPTVGRFIDYLTGKVAWREQTFKNIDTYLTKVVDTHLDPNRNVDEQEDIVDVMVGMMRDKTASFQITPTHIKSILTNVYIGIVDTSANTTSWALCELIKNQRVIKKVQAEIREIVGPNKKRVEGRDLDKLKYLECVLKETFRLHPTAPLLLPRCCIRHTKIGGYDVLPATQIFINAWGMGRDPKVWTTHDPMEFYPERFWDSEIDYRGQHYELVPFGAGRRMCPGYIMGSTAVKYILANVLYMFNLTLPGGMKFEDFPIQEQIGGLAIANEYDVIVHAKRHEFK